MREGVTKFIYTSTQTFTFLMISRIVPWKGGLCVVIDFHKKTFALYLVTGDAIEKGEKVYFSSFFPNLLEASIGLVMFKEFLYYGIRMVLFF